MRSTFLTSTINGLSCGSCGVVFGLESSMHERVKQTGELFYCPKGCHINYGDNENSRLKKQIEAEQERVKQEKATTDMVRKQRDNAMLEADHFRKSRDGMKGAYRKVAVRVKNGVCPCCKRTFSCLAEHMKAKHPDFSTTPKTEVP